MRCRGHGFQLPNAYVSVYLRRFEAGVPKDCLDVVCVHTSIEWDCGTGVAEQMADNRSFFLRV